MAWPLTWCTRRGSLAWRSPPRSWSPPPRPRPRPASRSAWPPRSLRYTCPWSRHPHTPGHHNVMIMMILMIMTHLGLPDGHAADGGVCLAAGGLGDHGHAGLPQLVGGAAPGGGGAPAWVRGGWVTHYDTLTPTYHHGAGINKQRGQVLSAVTVGEARGSGILVVSIE